MSNTEVLSAELNEAELELVSGGTGTTDVDLNPAFNPGVALPDVTSKSRGGTSITIDNVGNAGNVG